MAEKFVQGNRTTLVNQTSMATANKTPKFKIELSGGSGTSTLQLYVDEDASGTYDSIFGPANTGVNFNNGRYLAYAFINASDASATMRTAYCQVYSYDETNPPNVVSLPQSSTPLTANDFNRLGVEGNIPCYANPTTELHFTTDHAGYYKGAVKGYNSEYTNTTPQIS